MEGGLSSLPQNTSLMARTAFLEMKLNSYMKTSYQFKTKKLSTECSNSCREKERFGWSQNLVFFKGIVSEHEVLLQRLSISIFIAY